MSISLTHIHHVTKLTRVWAAQPHNVLLSISGRAKVSDMGLCIRLHNDASSFETPGSGSLRTLYAIMPRTRFSLNASGTTKSLRHVHCIGGSQGWQSYEQLLKRSGGTARQSKAVDVFSYGLLLHYCLSGGKHPFGSRFERDMNILQVMMEHMHDCAPKAMRQCCTCDRC